MNDIFVYASALNPNDIIVSDPNVLRVIGQIETPSQQVAPLSPFLTGGGQHIGKQKLVLTDDFDDEELVIMGLIHFLTR